MNKSKTGILLLLAGILLLPVCNTKAVADDQGKTGTGPGEKVELVISRWAGPHADDQAVILKQFEKETGIRVRMDAIDYSQLRQKQTLNLSGKTGAYDLVWVQEVWLPEYVSSGYLHPLDDFVKDEALNGKDFDFQDFNPNLIKINTINGKLYALPTFVQTPLMVYNKELLQKAALSAPKTWEETLAVAKVLHDKGKGIALPAKQGLAAVDIWIALARSNNGDYFDQKGKLQLVTEQNIETVEYWKNLVEVAMKGSTNWHFDEVNKALQFGEAPIGLTVSGLCGALEDEQQSKVAGKVGYAALPYKIRPFGTLSFWSWCVAADSRHPKEAYRLAAWLTSKSVEKEMSLKNGQIAARQSLFGDPELVSKAPWLAGVAEALKNAGTQPLHKNAPQLMEAMEAALSAVAVNGGDPKEQLEQVQKALAGEF
ncbi:MAG TPA: sugar ABC transporter substrate-binding protein [Chthoniobacterales bacterium]